MNFELIANKCIDKRAIHSGIRTLINEENIGKVYGFLKFYPR